MPFVVNIDGRIHPPAEAKVSVFDRGFLYGDSVFETIRTYSGRPFALDAHIARLKRSAELVYITLPVSPEELAREIHAALAEAGNAESYIRVLITRGQGELGLDPALADRATRVILVGELKPPPRSVYDEGVAVVSFKTQRPTDATPAEGAKIGNYLVAVLGMRRAREAGAFEALILGSGDRVVEGASSNVFAVRDGALITPPLEAGILPGITRDRILGAAERLSVPVHYACPTLVELFAMDEVFICSSIREIVPVVRCDGTTLGTGRPGPLTRRLHDAFLETVRAELGL